MGFYTDVKFTSFLESSKILEKKFFNFEDNLIRYTIKYPANLFPVI